MSERRVIKTDKEWRAQLTPEQFAVCRQQGTECAFSGAYYNCKNAGRYHCVCCDQALFSATAKYDSGSGWPSYFQPIADHAITSATDTKHGMHRVEVLCASCDAHLGHVFEDGPQPTGLRYCINSVALVLREDK